MQPVLNLCKKKFWFAHCLFFSLCSKHTNRLFSGKICFIDLQVYYWRKVCFTINYANDNTLLAICNMVIDHAA